MAQPKRVLLVEERLERSQQVESQVEQLAMKVVLLGLLLTGAIAIWQFDLLVEIYIEGADWLLRNVIF